MARHRFQPAATLLAMALVMCVAGCGSGHASTSPSASAPPSTSPTGTNKRVTMPPVQGDGVHIAMQLVKSSGLKKIKQVSKHSGVTAGIVTFTVPFAEQVVLADSLVTLYVSSGPALCAECAGGGATEVMPPVCGLNLRQAELLLVQNNITLPEPYVAHRLGLREPSSAQPLARIPASWRTAELPRKSCSSSRRARGRHRRREARVAADRRRPAG